MNLDITIKELPAKSLVGLSVRTNMQSAATDCPAIWRNFGPQIELLASRLGMRESYGASVMLAEDGTFDYWAAVEVPPETVAPEGMKTLALPAGFYACASVANLEQLTPAYSAIYMEWAPRQTEYALNMEAPCVEVYRENWQPSDPIDVWVPLK